MQVYPVNGTMLLSITSVIMVSVLLPQMDAS